MTIIYLGLDISKDKIDALTVQTPHITVSNDDAGYQQLLDYFKTHQLDLTRIHACCESTNIDYLGIETHAIGFVRIVSIAAIQQTKI